MKNPFQSTRIFVIEMVDELKKASWPTAAELRDSTILVIVAAVNTLGTTLNTTFGKVNTSINP